METLVKKLCPDLRLTASEYIGDTLELYVEYEPEYIPCCPKCGQARSAGIRLIYAALRICRYKNTRWFSF